MKKQMGLSKKQVFAIFLFLFAMFCTGKTVMAEPVAVKQSRQSSAESGQASKADPADSDSIEVCATGKTQSEAHARATKSLLFVVKAKVNESLVQFLQENQYEDFSYDSIIYDISLEAAQKSIVFAEYVETAVSTGENSVKVCAVLRTEKVFEELKKVLSQQNIEDVDFTAFTLQDLN